MCELVDSGLSFWNLLYCIIFLKRTRTYPTWFLAAPTYHWFPSYQTTLADPIFVGLYAHILGCEVSESVLTPSRYFGAVFQHIHGVRTGYNMVFFMNLFTREDDTMIELVDSEKLGPPQLDLCVCRKGEVVPRTGLT